MIEFYLILRLLMISIGLLSFIGTWLSSEKNINSLFLFFAAQILLTVSLQIEEAGKISIMRKSGDILFAFMFQIFIFNVSLKGNNNYRISKIKAKIFRNCQGYGA